MSHWINTVLSTLKTSFSGTYHCFDFGKYAQRYLRVRGDDGGHWSAADAAGHGREWREARRLQDADLAALAVQRTVIRRIKVHRARRRDCHGRWPMVPTGPGPSAACMRRHSVKGAGEVLSSVA